MAETTHKATPRDLLRSVFRRRLLFLSGTAIFAFAALVGALWWPVKYTAMAKFERRSDPASEALAGSKSESFETLKQVLQQELAGFNALNAAAEDLEKQELLPPLPRGNKQELTSEGKMVRQQVVRDLTDDLKVTFMVRSAEVDLVSVEFTDKDPRLAQVLPNTLVTNYINNISEKMIVNLTASVVFLQKKVDEANTRLTELLKTRTEFEKEHAGMLPENPGTLQQEVQRIDADMDRIGRQQSLAKMKLEQIKAFRAGGKAPSDNSPPASPKDKPEEKPAKNDTPPAASTKDKPEEKPAKKDTPPAASTKDKPEEKPAKNDTPPAASTKDKPEEKPAKKDAASSAAIEKKLTEDGQLLEREMVEVTQELGRLLDQQQQYQRSLDEGRTLNHMTEKHPRMEALKKQIKDLDDRIAKARTRLTDVQSRRSDYISRVKESLPDTARGSELVQSSPDPLLRRAFEMQMAQMVMEETAAQLEVNLTTSELGRLKDHQDKLRKVLDGYVPKRQEYVEIVKKVTDQQAEVNRWQARLTGVNMDLAAEAAKRRTHLSQVELAQEQFRPSSPKLLYVIAFALVGGLAFGGGLVFLANTMDRSVSTTEDAVDCFGLPILGIIGEIVTSKQKTRRKMIRVVLRAVAVLAVAAIGLAAMNITLWLNDRSGFEEWKKAPVSFVWGGVKGQLDALKSRL